jgi:hypothetical protein
MEWSYFDLASIDKQNPGKEKEKLDYYLGNEIMNLAIVIDDAHGTLIKERDRNDKPHADNVIARGKAVPEVKALIANLENALQLSQSDEETALKKIDEIMAKIEPLIGLFWMFKLDDDGRLMGSLLMGLTRVRFPGKPWTKELAIECRQRISAIKDLLPKVVVDPKYFG